MFKKALTPEQQTVHDIINRVCWAHGVKNKAALERKIALSDSWCTNTIKRGSTPYALEDLEQLAKKQAADIEHELTIQWNKNTKERA